ncbi:MAG: hypothetical protein ABSB78_14330 [Bacteroidota bacterium]
MRISIPIFIFCIGNITFGQPNADQIKWINEQLSAEDLYTKEYREQYLKNDFSSLWMNSNYVLGFIGPNYQRLHLKIISVTKDSEHPDSYQIIGKSMVKKNICDFTGRIIITNVRVYKNMHYGADDEYKDIKQEGVVVGEYHFMENHNQKSSGTFDGVFCSWWFVDKSGCLKYDAIEDYSDGYCNNQFVGTWTRYGSKESKACNWGDCRIPLSGDLDIGDGEFYPQDKYLIYGWQSYIDAWEKYNYDKQARQEEQRKWWEQ